MSEPTFVGRDQDLAILVEHLQRAAEGKLELVAVEGEAGIGKSALLDKCLDVARAEGFGVFYGRCEQLTQTRPFGPVLEALDIPSSRSLPGLTMGGSVDKQSHFQTSEAIVDLIEDDSAKRPSVLALEDLQWADVSTLYALRLAAKRLRFQPVSILVTLRPLPRSSHLQALLQTFREEGHLLLELDALSQESVRTLVAEELGADASDELLRLAGTAGGNPFFIRELLDDLRRSNAVEMSTGTVSLSVYRATGDLRHAVLSRISYLSPRAKELLRIAAVIGTRFSVEELTAAARAGVAELLPVVEEWRTGGLVEVRGETLAFRHDLIREALYDEISPPLRSQMHLELASALETGGGALDRVAHHYMVGATPPDEEAALALRRAAASNVAHPETRIELLRRALALAGNRETSDTVGVDLAEAIVWGGRPEEAEELARSLLITVKAPPQTLKLREVLLLSLRLSARWEELASAAKQWSSLPHDGLEPGYLRAVEAYAHARMDPLPLKDARGLAVEALEEAVRAGNTQAQYTALSATFHVNSRLGNTSEMLEAADAMLALAVDDPEGRLWLEHPHLQRAVALLGLYRFEEAEDALRAGLRIRELTGTVWELPMFHNAFALLRIYQRRFRDAMTEAQTALSLSEELGVEMAVGEAHERLASAALYAGELELAETELAKATRSDTRWRTDTAEALSTRTILAMIGGSKEDAARSWLEYLELAAEERSLPPLEAIRAFIDAGLLERAQFWVALAEEIAADGDSGALIRAQAARALVEDDLQALRRLAEATQDLRPEHQSIWEELAVMEAARGFLAEARDRASKAVAALEGDQVPGWRIEVFLRRLRPYRVELPGRRRRRRRSLQGWESLTESELKVVDLATRGLTNPQIAERLYISRHTVVSHLSNVFSKLGISSRVELAAQAALRRRGPS